MGSRVILGILVSSFKIIHLSSHTDVGEGQIRTGLCFQIEGQHKLAAINLSSSEIKGKVWKKDVLSFLNNDQDGKQLSELDLQRVLRGCTHEYRGS